jgi:hypothetical protein
MSELAAPWCWHAWLVVEACAHAFVSARCLLRCRCCSEYRVGTCISVDLPSIPGRPGETGARSLALIVDVLEDMRTGHCHIAVHYFWRWVRALGV